MQGLALSLLVLTLSGPAGKSQAPAAAPPWHGLTFLTTAMPSSAVPPSRWQVDFRTAGGSQGGGPRPKAVQYSHGYAVRLRIHRDASFAMLPLFGAEAVIGQKLYSNPTHGLRTAHGALNVGILGLFGVDTVTGLWNMKEGWHDPHGRARRLIHGLLMLTADAGFVATDLSAPHFHDRTGTWSGSRSLHRNVALASVSVATLGYLIMIFR